MRHNALVFGLTKRDRWRTIFMDACLLDVICDVLADSDCIIVAAVA